MIQLEWNKHPDGTEFYAFCNDDGDALYAVVEHQSDWIIYVNGIEITDSDNTVVRFIDAATAKRWVQDDLEQRLRRLGVKL